MIRYIHLFILVIFIIPGCKSTDVSDSSNVAQSEIYQSYSSTYSEDENQTVFEAMFRFGGSGGTTLRLSGASSVSVNDTKMEGMDILFSGFLYRTQVPGFQAQAKFRFEDTEGKKYLNSLRLEPASLDPLPQEINASAETPITWQGPIPRGEEYIMLKVVPDSGRTLMVNPEESDVHTFILKPSDFSELKGENLRISLYRRLDMRLVQQTHLGGEMMGLYEGKRYQVKLKGNPIQ